MRLACVISFLLGAGIAFAIDTNNDFQSAGRTSLEEAVKPILEAHCFACHCSQTIEGNLNLALLPLDLGKPETFDMWVKVHDRVREGEMPPSGEKQLAPIDRENLLIRLDKALHEADAARQRNHGRTMARRLNRDEYQNTLRDLLGVVKDYRGLLPADGSALGFDKVGSALSISPEHLEAYLAAADAALAETIVSGPRPAFMQKHIPQRYRNYFTQSNYEKSWGHLFLDLPDAFVRFTTFNDSVSGFRAESPGLYRLRIRARAYESDEPIRARIRAGYPGENASGDRWLVGYEDFPSEGKVFETIQYLNRGDTIRISPYGLAHRIFQNRSDSRRNAFTGMPGLALEYVEAEGPLYASWPPAGHQALFGDLDFESATGMDAERVLRKFLPRAFRRPVLDDEVTHYLEIYERAAEPHGFLIGMNVALKAALCSPHFLFLYAPAGPLDDYSLAARLAYFLWSAPPDEELNSKAEMHELRNPEVLHQQVERLLNNPKAEEFHENFTGQWLDLRKITATAPDVKLYPEFDELLEYSMVRETRMFFKEVLTNDLSLTNFVKSDFAMLNDRLALQYGIPDIQGVEIRKVTLPTESQRGGVLSQAAVLKVTANGTTTSPVVRGAWVMDRLLDKPPPPPPSSVPAIEPDIRGETTIRAQLEKHRADQSCAICHAKIDPAGFALESFDVIGGWRTRYRVENASPMDRSTVEVPERQRATTIGNGPDVDASGKMPDGRAFAGFEDFRQLLLEDKDQLARALASKLLTYSSGTGVQYADRAAIETIVAKIREHHYGFRSLVHEVVRSSVFLQQ